LAEAASKLWFWTMKAKPQTERSRLETPQPPKPEPVLEAIASLASGQGEFDRVSVGFPGVVSG
jgi:polyphosphate glucokinase